MEGSTSPFCSRAVPGKSDVMRSNKPGRLFSMKNARFGHPSRTDRVQGLVRHGGVRSRRANRARRFRISEKRVGGDDWASRTAPSPTERRSKTVFERREIVVGDEPSICTLEGRGRESIAKKYVPDAPAAQISNFKASSSGDGKQHLGRRGRQANRPAIFLHRPRMANGVDTNA
jgi:hypothetical protein